MGTLDKLGGELPSSAMPIVLGFSAPLRGVRTCHGRGLDLGASRRADVPTTGTGSLVWRATPSLSTSRRPPGIFVNYVASDLCTALEPG